MRNDSLARHYITTFSLTFNFFSRIKTFKNSQFKLTKTKITINLIEVSVLRISEMLKNSLWEKNEFALIRKDLVYQYIFKICKYNLHRLSRNLQGTR